MTGFRIVPVRSRIAVLASGGLDSSVLIAELARHGRVVYPIYVRAGLRWERDEIRVLRRYLRAVGNRRVAPLSILALPTRDVSSKHWSITGTGVPGYRAATASNYIVGRNLTLLAKASLFCARNRIGELAMASLDGNPFPDARSQFFRAFERAASLGLDMKLKISTPYRGLAKARVIRRGRAMPLQLTISCAQPRGVIHCGRCTKCAERIKAFRAAGVLDPTRYASKGD
ncbi:MAG TPA: 7-cyano-7-deazaguanine synthase [Candidatus Binataceae bacterium]|nr:7-cyano-7-deazaguanine synthase [Candidatus Binataceae bacterium]